MASNDAVAVSVYDDQFVPVLQNVLPRSLKLVVALSAEPAVAGSLDPAFAGAVAAAGEAVPNSQVSKSCRSVRTVIFGVPPPRSTLRTIAACPARNIRYRQAAKFRKWNKCGFPLPLAPLPFTVPEQAERLSSEPVACRQWPPCAPDLGNERGCVINVCVNLSARGHTVSGAVAVLQPQSPQNKPSLGLHNLHT